MKKKLIAMLLCAILAASVVMTACTPEQTPTTTQKPEASKPTESTPYVPKDVTVSLVITNGTGRACPDVVMTVRAKDSKEFYNVTGDANGNASVILTEGEYIIYFESVPEYHLAPDYDLTVKAGMPTVTIELINNEPNGTEEKPFPLGDKNDTKHFAANETFWYQIRVGEGRTVKIRNANVELVHDGATYTPDENGEINFRLQADDPKTQIKFTVTNKSAEEQDIELILEGDPGTHDNPIVVAGLNQPQSAVVMGTESVYFRYEVTQNGTLVLTSEDPNNNINMLNHRNTQMTQSTLGDASVSMDVKAGDIITIEVNVCEEVDGGDEISFILSIE